jgi:hypothetical protein
MSFVLSRKQPGAALYLQSAVNFAVIRGTHQLKIFWYIVKCISVQMMDVFVVAKWASDDLRHDIAMLKYPAALLVDFDVHVSRSTCAAASYSFSSDWKSERVSHSANRFGQLCFRFGRPAFEVAREVFGTKSFIHTIDVLVRKFAAASTFAALRGFDLWHDLIPLLSKRKSYAI